jgi:hypothetical protein
MNLVRISAAGKGLFDLIITGENARANIQAVYTVIVANLPMTVISF